MKNSVEMRTMDVVYSEIEANISQYNLSESTDEKVELTVKLQELIKEYNQMSLLSAYAGFMAAEKPMLAFAKAYTYPMLRKVDKSHEEMVNGVKTQVQTRVIDDECTGFLNIKNFIKWAAERGNKVAESKDWVTKMGAARDAIISMKQREYSNTDEVEDGKKKPINVVKDALQALIDALLVIPGEKGGNALVVNRSSARAVADLCTQGAKDFLSINVAAKKNWEKAAMALLHLCVEGKDFTIVYGDPDENTAEADAEATVEVAADESSN